MKKNYLNTELCAECEGRCCKRMPGAAFPVDFKKPLAKSLLTAFKSGHWAIDWYEGDPTGRGKLEQVYYIRPKIKDTKELFDPAWGGKCIFLARDGCTLKSLERPKACRLMEPVTLTKCTLHAGDKGSAARAWLPHQRTILKAAKTCGEGVEDAVEHPALEALTHLMGG